MENDEIDVALSIAERLKHLRSSRGLTLDQLAEVSGVSRAMISRIERAEASPTAALLARLCSALGLSLSVFFEPEEAPAEPLLRREDQPVWRDPESGYLRRVVGPRGTRARVDVVEVEFPACAEVRFHGQPGSRAQWQHVWVFEGSMEVSVADKTHTLSAGDCLYMNVDDVRAFRNPSLDPARYAVIIDLGPR